MSSKIHPYRIHPRYKISVVTPPNENVISNRDPISQSDVNFTPSSSKPQKFPWPNVLWIGLGVFVFICLVIVIVVPIVALANQGETTTTTTTTTTISTTTVSTICPTTSVTSTVTSNPLPDQCSNYVAITDDDTRSPNYSGPSSCDDAIFFSVPYWVRFSGTGGTLLATCPIDSYLCGTDNPGWYAGLHPSTAGDVTSGYVCFNYNADLCGASNLILVTNCNGFYVYYLEAPPVCDARYCTI